MFGLIYWVELLTNPDIKKVAFMNRGCMMPIYNYIADIYNTKGTAVERDLRYCMQFAKENLKKKYHWQGKISVKTFLYLRLIGDKLL